MVASCHRFEGLLNELESRKDDLKINSYGLSVTTMEEVFLKTSRMDHEVEAEDDSMCLCGPYSMHTAGGGAHVQYIFDKWEHPIVHHLMYVECSFIENDLGTFCTGCSESVLVVTLTKS